MRVEREQNIIRLRPRNETQFLAQGRTVFATGQDGFVSKGSEHGLFVHETRMISQYRYRIVGSKIKPSATSNTQQHTWMGYYITKVPGVKIQQPDTGSGLVDPASEYTLELRLSRFAGEGIHEDVDLTNFSLQPTSFTLELEVAADFADQIEVHSQRKQQGELHIRQLQPKDGVWELVFDYITRHHYNHQGNVGQAGLHRSLTLQVLNADSPPQIDENHIRFQIDLAPRGTWHTCINLIPWLENVNMDTAYNCRSFEGVNNDYDDRRIHFLENATKFDSAESRTLASVVVSALEQAKRDLASLRLYDLDENPRAWTVAAGFPSYVALFGRDVLTAAWQAAMMGPEMMVGTANVIAKRQGNEINDWRDEQPGRMLHEAHTGPLEILNFNPRRMYYGSVTTSGFFPVVLSELWHWTGDVELIEPLVDPMLGALEWLNQYSDLDSDGFYEYKTRSEQGSKHQAWKDSRDAIVDRDGRQVQPPISTCEEQGFAYLAMLRAAELLWWLDRRDEAAHFYQQAQELKDRFNSAFWMPEEGFYALGLDSKNRQIRSIASNPGHLLATGIVDQEYVQATADRLMAGDLFTGWGVRTLSDKNPAYNPFSYHRGSVWPVEQATFTTGFMRYGLHEHNQRLSRAVFESTELFDFYRLPEVFSGHPRDDEHPFPGLYPQTNWPQAWSSSALFLIVQSLLGIYPYAALNLLLVDPHLPDWLPEFIVRQLQVGKASVDLHFFRKEDGSSDYEILDQSDSLHVVRQPSPWSLTASYGERLVDALKSMLPGK